MENTLNFNSFNTLNEEELLSIDGGNFSEWARGIAKASLAGGAGGATAGAAAGLYGAPFTEGASIPTCAAAGYVGGATAGAVTYIVNSWMD
ncbi:Blp family class II bacteriocin [Clostridium sp.]|uniref:Blp family class II bacteriocin n=1 Tax=Clostridium sp. TaxID=1506 RepID=UPI00283C6E52|nr:Blp family class II bacteriocin [Clostridium sp.]MDR3598487.1 Blp family class II bacteriocin [Clostridium sp.]